MNSLGAIALWLRMKLDEPEAFSQTALQQQGNRKPFRGLFTGDKKHIFMLMALVVLLNVGQYMVLTYMPTNASDDGYVLKAVRIRRVWPSLNRSRRHATIGNDPNQSSQNGA